MARPLTQLEKHYARRGWRWSLALHINLVCAWLLQAVWMPWPAVQPVSSAHFFIAHVAPVNEMVEITVEMPLEERAWMAREAESVSFAPVDLHDPAWKAILEEPFYASPVVAPRDFDLSGKHLLTREIQRSISATAEKSEQENLAELARLSNKLSAVSSEQSVVEVNGTLGRLLGTGERATAPKEIAPAGAFDYTSAQVHDVRQETAADGTVRYLALMLDAAGRTQEVELEAANGERLLQTMQLVKSNPLLERVYRGVVMGLIDQALKASN